MAAKVDDLVKFKWHGTGMIIGSRIYDVKLLTSHKTGIQKGQEQSLDRGSMM